MYIYICFVHKYYIYYVLYLYIHDIYDNIIYIQYVELMAQYRVDVEYVKGRSAYTQSFPWEAAQ